MLAGIFYILKVVYTAYRILLLNPSGSLLQYVPGTCIQHANTPDHNGAIKKHQHIDRSTI